MGRPWVLLDTSYLAYRAHYGNADLVWEDLRTEILYGFWEQLRVICNHEMVNSTRIVACCDSRSSLRRKAFPGYKASRREEQTFEEREERRIIHDQVRLLRDEVLPEVGILVLRQDGLESDDVMAQAVLQLSDQKCPEQAILVTADGDLWQCINENTIWFDPSRGLMYDLPTFIEKKGIDPRLWGNVKCYAGCSSDAVPGIPGVGEKTAVKYLLNELPSRYKTYQAIQSPEGERIYQRNFELVVLPHKATQKVVLRKPEFNVSAFFKMCERYGFLSYLRPPMKGMWEDFFQVGRGQVRTRKRRKG